MAEDGLRVLVTGADGCIGAWVLKGALARGWSPVALDLARQPSRPRLVLSDDDLATIPWISADIVDTDAIMRVFGEFAVDAVIHLGALQVLLLIALVPDRRLPGPEQAPVAADAEADAPPFRPAHHRAIAGFR